MFCQHCGEELKEEVHTCLNKKEEKPKKKSKTAFLVTMVGLGFFLLESISDLFLKDFYGSTLSQFIKVDGIESVMTGLAVFGVIIAVFLTIFTIFAREKSYYYTVVLVSSLIALFGSLAFYSPMLLIVGGVMGIINKREEEDQ